MNIIKLFFTATLLINLYCPSSWATQESFEKEDLFFIDVPVVTVAALTEQTIEEVPGTITVITEKQISDYGLQTFGDIYNIIPGFQEYISNYGPYSPLVRGYEQSQAHVKVMIDGFPVNTAFNRGCEAYYRFPLDNIKQIEIIRGPGSALYGTCAHSAVINIITKKTERTTVSLGGGEFNNKSISLAHYSDPKQKINYSATFDYELEDGDKLTYETDYLTGTGMSYAPNTREKNKDSIGGSLSLNYNNLSLSTRHADYTQAWTHGYMNIQSPEEEFYRAKNTYIELNYKPHISNNSSLFIQGGYDINYFGVNGQLFPPGFTWGADINGDGTLDSWPNGANFHARMLGEKYSIDLLYQTTISKQEISIGTQYEIESFKEAKGSGNINFSNMSKVPENTEFPGDSPYCWLTGEGKSETLIALYLQDIFKATEKLNVIAGARYDNYSLAGSEISPRAALIWNAFTNHNIKLSYGKAFFVPLLSRRYLNTFGYHGNPDLEPQTIQTHEISLQNYVRNKLHYNIVGFYSTITDLIAFDRNLDPSYWNIGKISYIGAELETTWHINNTLQIWGNYSYSDGRDEIAEEDYSGVRHLGNIGLVVKPAKKITLSSFAHISGKYKRISTRPNADEDIDGWTTINSAFTYNIAYGMQISLIARNLFNEQYYSINPVTNAAKQASDDYVYEGRQVLVKLGYKW